MEDHQNLQEKIRMCQLQLPSYFQFHITEEERQECLAELGAGLKEHILRPDVVGGEAVSHSTKTQGAKSDDE